MSGVGSVLLGLVYCMAVKMLEYMPRTFSQRSRIVSQGIVRIYAVYYKLALVRCEANESNGEIEYGRVATRLM